MAEVKAVTDRIRVLEEEVRRLRRACLMHGMEELFETLPPEISPATRITLEERIAVVLDKSIGQLRANIIEPSKNGSGGTPELIDQLIRAPGCANWYWLEQYKRNGQYAWCGYAQSYAFRSAGLKSHIVQKVLPSCYRLKKWAKENNAFVLDFTDVQPGDIVLFDTYGDKGADHITLCWTTHLLGFPSEFTCIAERARSIYGNELGGHRRYYTWYIDTPHIITLEGNAKGLTSSGHVEEGYVTRLRPMADIRNIIRFREEDFDGI